MNRPVRPVHTTMLGRPVPSTCRPVAGCKCEPIQLSDMEEPSRVVWLHRAAVATDTLARAARVADFADQTFLHRSAIETPKETT